MKNREGLGVTHEERRREGLARLTAIRACEGKVLHGAGLLRPVRAVPPTSGFCSQVVPLAYGIHRECFFFSPSSSTSSAARPSRKHNSHRQRHRQLLFFTLTCLRFIFFPFLLHRIVGTRPASSFLNAGGTVGYLLTSLVDGTPSNNEPMPRRVWQA